MFEKEAIRHAFEVTIGLDCLIKPAEEFTYEELDDHLQEKADDFQDGAEFGYNKAKEEYATELKEVVETCNHWQEVAEKANEWHYVKDGEYPKECACCLLYLGSRFNCITGWRLRGVWYFEDNRDLEMWQDEVIAWKEIVLPKEVKENG